MSQTQTQTKRIYNRRSDAERLQLLQQKLESMQQRLKEREQRGKHVPSPVSKKIPRLIKKLKSFANFAHENDRLDLYNSTTAFVAMLDRMYIEDMDPAGQRGRTGSDESTGG